MCPKCQKPLIVLELDGVELDWCPACRGTWLDTGELELIAELAGGEREPLHAALEQPGAAGQRRCPRCRKKMRVVTLHQSSSGSAGHTDPGATRGAPAASRVTLAEIDRCPAGDGIWLDAGELASIVGAYAQHDKAAVARFLGNLFSTSGSSGPERG